MTKNKENSAKTSNRVLLAGGVLFISGILWLYVFEALNASSWGVKVYLSMVLLPAFVADRLFVKHQRKIKSRTN
jgi:apolipoprotein N-acyltransferase